MTATCDYAPRLNYRADSTRTNPADGGSFAHLISWVGRGAWDTNLMGLVHPILKQVACVADMDVDEDSGRRLALLSPRFATTCDRVVAADIHTDDLETRLALWAARHVVDHTAEQWRPLSHVILARAEALNDGTVAGDLPAARARLTADAETVKTGRSKTATEFYAARCVAEAIRAVVVRATPERERGLYEFPGTPAVLAISEALNALGRTTWPTGGNWDGPTTVDFLTGLLDEFDHLTGTTSAPMTREQAEQIRALSPALR